MLELQNICKSYKTGTFTQKALDGISITFRDCEFVAVLGPSGSGKTTLLNILGGLDHADEGDLVINGISTKKYRSGDWDTYRNHRIGFIFQSYNLIPHQSVLSNVELALTLAGVSRTDRKHRAVEALERVGLGEHIDKKPNQLSGGQMQRVAIARALVNNPDIVLADEPTGALDTDTGLQVMDLLSEIARDRLVIMVTHNPELAETYANRIVRLSDGRITDDSNPFEPPVQPAAAATAETSAASSASASAANDAAVTANDTAATTPLDSAVATVPLATLPADATTIMPAVTTSTQDAAEPSKGRKRKASMNFLTALALSFNNLMTKKGRTFMTAFAGSIGIIGIAAILALSNGVNNYIAKVEQDTLSSYPLSITSSSYDFTSLLTGDTSSETDGAGVSVAAGDGSGASSESTATSSLIPESTIVSDMFAKVKTNDLASFKSFLDSGQSDIDSYVSTIKYDYDITPQIYKTDTSSGVVQLNPSSISTLLNSSASASGSFGSTLMSTTSFSEMIDDQALLDSQYDVVAGNWPENYDECVLVLSGKGAISDFTLYNMGILDPAQLKDMTEKVLKSESVEVPGNEVDISYDDVLAMTFKVVSNANLYKYNADYNTWTDMSSDTGYMTQQIANGTTLKIVGVVRPNETTNSPALEQGIAYTHALTTHLMDDAANADIVKQQIANPDVDVFTGKTFTELQDENNSLDMGQFFSIDENAIQNAIKFDSSALNIDTSGMSFDTSSLDMGSLDLSSLSSSIDMTSIMANMPQPDLSKMDMNLSDADQASIAALEAQVVAGFLPYWYSQHPGESITVTTDLTADLQGYMQTTAVQTAMTQIATIMGKSTSAAVQTAMQDYLTNTFAPYLQNAMQTAITQMASQMATTMASQMASAMTSAIESSMASMTDSLSSNMANAISVDENAFANAIQFNMTQDDLTSLLTNYANAGNLTYDNNLSTLGYAQESKPKTISIYPKDFASKESVLSIIDDYNNQMKDEGKDDQVISYSDIIGALMSSVTDIVNTISLVLIAFVSISLVVSSIMIGIITYISVLERKKEIGILRAMGASKRNVANVFNAETIIEGLIAGVFAIIVVLVASIPVNAWVLANKQVPNIMSLPWTSALALIGISVLLTFIAGLIPSQAASRRDPVEALRSE